MESVIRDRLQANIWKFSLHQITNKRVFVAILGAYYLTIPGVTAMTIGTLLLVGNVAGFLLEIPSGYLSDKWGHKQALVVSRMLMMVSTLLFLFASNVWLLGAASVFLSAAFAFSSGTSNAFMHETLRALGREHEYARVMGKLSSIGFAVPIVLMVLVPFLVNISYQLPFLIALVTDVIGLFAVLSLTTPPVSAEEIKEIGLTNFRQVMQEGARLNFFTIAVFSGLVSGMLLAVGAFRAPYQVVLEVPVIWFGVLFGIGRAVASLMLAYSGWIKGKFTLQSFFLFEVVFYTILLLLLGLVAEWWVVVLVFILVNGAQWGFMEVDKGYQLEVIRASKFKATLLSARSQISSLIAAVAAFGTGVVIEYLSYQLGFLWLAGGFVLIAIPLYLRVRRLSRLGVYGA